jgi:hypothetical protein
MPTLDQHQSTAFVKMIYIGDSGTGKTGSLVSLLAEGYKFKIIDMDNGLDFFVQMAKAQGLQSKFAGVEFETIRDTYGVSAAQGAGVKGSAKAFTDALKKMTEWSSIEDDKTIFVLDSLSAFGKAAFEWARFMNPGSKDPRQWYFAAQQAVENVIALITGADFKMNAIVISHVNYKEVTEGVHKGYANAVGSALGPTISKYFNTLILAESIGAGKNVKRRIKTMPTGVIDLKISIPEFDAELPLETGLATIFAKLKETEHA